MGFGVRDLGRQAGQCFRQGPKRSGLIYCKYYCCSSFKLSADKQGMMALPAVVLLHRCPQLLSSVLPYPCNYLLEQSTQTKKLDHVVY